MSLPNGIMVKKRLLFVLLVFSLILGALIFRVGWLQIVNGKELSKKAHENQTRGNVINPQRGTIYDRNGKELGVSASVETVTVNPNEVKNAKNVKSEDMAQLLASILSMDSKEVLAKITKNSYYEVVKRKIDKPIADQIRAAQAEKKLPGIALVDDKKRFYPNSNFAAQVIGFTGDDNQGLAGIELKYDKYLRGSSGRLISATDANGREIAFSDEQYISPVNGNDVYLTIDEVIQHFTEKALDNAVVTNKVKKGTAIVVDVKTGEILALASKPDFNLNTPFEPIDVEMKAKWDTLSKQDKNIELQKLWRNPAISDTYEPGSVFKMVTSAAALEENVVKNTDMFNCVGYTMVGGFRIKCWRFDRPHGLETFVQGVQNSCNPVFMEIAQRMGVHKFYNYIKGFGFMEKTGIDLPGETADTIFHKESDMGPVELATYSFGQGFQITPMQMMDAVCAVANDGKLIKPHTVKQIKDKEGNIVKSIEPEAVRQVISKETSAQLRSILESVVSEGTGKNAYIPGYKIAGKTGTSEKLPRGSGKYIASFGAFAPADDPRIAVLVILDEPTAGVIYGGQIAAPVVQQIFDDTFRYLDIEPKYSAEEQAKIKQVVVPDVKNMTVNDAVKILQNAGVSYKVEGQGDRVVEQMPVCGVTINQNTSVFLFLNQSAQNAKKTVPDLTGKTVDDASKTLSDSGLGIKINGSGQAVSQSIAPGTQVDVGTIVTVDFRTADIQD